MAVDFKKRTINITGKHHDIIRYEVWFQTPMGLSAQIDEAIKNCEEHDLAPNLCIVPVPVAIGPDEFYEIVGR